MLPAQRIAREVQQQEGESTGKQVDRPRVGATLQRSPNRFIAVQRGI
jgi:hypothetical protein